VCRNNLFFDYDLQHGADIEVVSILVLMVHDWMDDDRAVLKCIVQALRREVLAVYGDGRQTRSFCFVDDHRERRPDVSRARRAGVRTSCFTSRGSLLERITL
jgi:hypothetical protein